jgi:hypothetical protein
VQRGHAVALRGVHVGGLLEQRFHRLAITASGCISDWRLSGANADRERDYQSNRY